MSAIGELGASIIALAAMLPLTLGLVSLVAVGNRQLKVHALSLAGTGPVVLLLSAPAWGGGGRTIVTALVLAGVLLVTTGMSGHAIMRLIAVRANSVPGRQGSASGTGPDEAGGSRRD